MSLRNQRNNCWYHSCLHLLTGVPPFRASYKNAGSDIFSKSFTAAIDAILSFTSRVPVDTFFSLFETFKGLTIATVRWLFLISLNICFTSIPSLFNGLRSDVSTSLQCQ